MGYPADQAQDPTQDFFMRVLEGRYLERADPEKGRFRFFLLTSLKFFVDRKSGPRRAFHLIPLWAGTTASFRSPAMDFLTIRPRDSHTGASAPVRQVCQFYLKPVQ